MDIWQKHTAHDGEIRKELQRQGCMDKKGRLRSWKRNTWEKLGELGHTSLDFRKCACSKG